jgi:signal transduction histidine kinase/CheY-like chemotaxis protein
MTAARANPFSGRLVVVLGSALALLIAGLLSAFYGESLYRAQKVRDVTVQAQILADTVTAAVAFDDHGAAQEYVDALRDNPQIEVAGVYDQTGALMAGYGRGGARPPARLAGAPILPAFSANVQVTEPVALDGHPLGRVYLRARLEQLGARLARYSGAGLLIVMAAVALAVLGSAQAALSRANTELERRARDLSQANADLQAEMVERERVEASLRQSQKMEALGRLTGGVAHDFNNLLMVISGGLEVMERIKDPDRRAKLRQGVFDAVHRGAGLTRQLLAFSRRTALKAEVVDLGEQIAGLRVLLDRSLREDISVDMRIAPDLWPVETDPSELQLALLNIAVNARDAMPDGGAIVISAENVPGLAEGELRGDFVRLSVRDQGSGIAPDVLAKVFEPFFTTKAVGRGTGLGLSQVYGFARASGGEVRIESTPGAGTRVHILLPRTFKTAKPQAAPRPAEVASSRPGDILLVEDDDEVAGVVGGLLADLGWSVRRVGAAAAALAALAEGAHFDLVLSDMIMPGEMGGLQLAREVGLRYPSLPVLLTTGFSEAAAAATAEGMRLLPKPYESGALAEALEAARGDKRGQRLRA